PPAVRLAAPQYARDFQARCHALSPVPSPRLHVRAARRRLRRGFHRIARYPREERSGRPVVQRGPANREERTTLALRGRDEASEAEEFRRILRLTVDQDLVM